MICPLCLDHCEALSAHPLPFCAACATTLRTLVRVERWKRAHPERSLADRLAELVEPQNRQPPSEPPAPAPPANPEDPTTPKR